jgi:hypothetical protein
VGDVQGFVQEALVQIRHLGGDRQHGDDCARVDHDHRSGRAARTASTMSSTVMGASREAARMSSSALLPRRATSSSSPGVLSIRSP